LGSGGIVGFVVGQIESEMFAPRFPQSVRTA
jgi:hypothetical protein